MCRKVSRSVKWNKFWNLFSYLFCLLPVINTSGLHLYSQLFDVYCMYWFTLKFWKLDFNLNSNYIKLEKLKWSDLKNCFLGLDCGLETIKKNVKRKKKNFCEELKNYAIVDFICNMNHMFKTFFKNILWYRKKSTCVHSLVHYLNFHAIESWCDFVVKLLP